MIESIIISLLSLSLQPALISYPCPLLRVQPHKISCWVSFFLFFNTYSGSLNCCMPLAEMEEWDFGWGIPLLYEIFGWYMPKQPKQISMSIALLINSYGYQAKFTFSNVKKNVCFSGKLWIVQILEDTSLGYLIPFLGSYFATV